LNAVENDAISFEFEVEGKEDVTVAGVSAHASADALVREFEHGILLANPSQSPYTFDLSALYPGQSFHRLQGSKDQDPVTNDGSTVGGQVELAAKDGLFLVK